LGTVTKALTLLDHFTPARPQIGLSDMARLAGLNKATTHRLLAELQSAGFVEQVGPAREYRLGVAVLRLAALREAAAPLREVAQTVLRALAQATGETAHMSLMQGDRLVVQAHAYAAAHGTRVGMEDTSVLPLHATSSGTAVLAFLPEPEREAVLAGPLPRLTADTVTDPATLRQRLAATRCDGIAQGAGGFEIDVHSQAAPLFDADGRVSGALAVAAPRDRMTPPRAAATRAALRAAAADLTRRLGGVPPRDWAEAVA
jgi:DNA-binding IclR family transcriptional regulator